jgi:hypothetical protein
MAGGINTYTYVENNPLRFTDPGGLVTWTGTQTGGEFFAAGGFLFTLRSECINGQRTWVKVLALGPGAGFGIDFSATHEKAQVVDSLSTPDPNVFNGLFFQSSAGFSIPPTPQSMAGQALVTKQLPRSHGVSASAVQIGGARGIGAGPVSGFDVGIGFLIGSSTVIDSGVENCCE